MFFFGGTVVGDRTEPNVEAVNPDGVAVRWKAGRVTGRLGRRSRRRGGRQDAVAPVPCAGNEISACAVVLGGCRWQSSRPVDRKEWRRGCQWHPKGGSTERFTMEAEVKVLSWETGGRPNDDSCDQRQSQRMSFAVEYERAAVLVKKRKGAPPDDVTINHTALAHTPRTTPIAWQDQKKINEINSEKTEWGEKIAREVEARVGRDDVFFRKGEKSRAFFVSFLTLRGGRSHYGSLRSS